MTEVQLKINREKSEFGCAEIRYLGYIVDKYGLQTDPEKTKVELEYPAPKDLKQLRSFLGMVGCRMPD